MAGRKFGAEGDLSLTWAMNAHVPALVAQAFPDSRIVAFSTGCVYPFVPVNGKGADESVAPDPPANTRNPASARAHVRIFFRAGFRRPAGCSAELRDRHAIRRAARHRRQRSWRRSRSTSASAMSTSSGRATPQPRRCVASRIATPRPRRSMSAAMKSFASDLAARLGARLDREPNHCRDRAADAWLTDTSQAVKLLACRSSTPAVDRLDADWVPARCPASASPPNTRYDGRY